MNWIHKNFCLWRYMINIKSLPHRKYPSAPTEQETLGPVCTWWRLVWFGLVYLFIHSVTYVTLDTSVTDYNLYITTQLTYIILSFSGIILWLSDHPTCIHISQKALPFDSGTFKTVKFIITHTSMQDLDISIWTTKQPQYSLPWKLTLCLISICETYYDTHVMELCIPSI